MIILWEHGFDDIRNVMLVAIGVVMLTWNELGVQVERHASNSRPNPKHPVAIPEVSAANKGCADAPGRVQPHPRIPFFSGDHSRHKNKKPDNNADDGEDQFFSEIPRLLVVEGHPYGGPQEDEIAKNLEPEALGGPEARHGGPVGAGADDVEGAAPEGEGVCGGGADDGFEGEGAEHGPYALGEDVDGGAREGYDP